MDGKVLVDVGSFTAGFVIVLYCQWSRQGYMCFFCLTMIVLDVVYLLNIITIVMPVIEAYPTCLCHVPSHQHQPCTRHT